MSLLTPAVKDLVTELPCSELPAYVYDLRHLSDHVARIRAALPKGLELYYAAKANAEPELLRVLAHHVDGFDVSSGGELLHVRSSVPEAPLAFSGPGKSPAELATALEAGIERVHIESLHELAVIESLAARPVDVLLRVNVDLPDGVLVGQALTMGGSPSPFGLEPGAAAEALRRAAAGELEQVRIRGVHAHLASGLDATQHVDVARRIVTWSTARFADAGVRLHEVNVGGGMSVNYADPNRLFDWTEYGAGMAELLHDRPGLTLRIEPGRAVTAYSGWYATEVLDVKPSHGREFAVVCGGTHHLRTPATKGHDQPCAILPVDDWEHPWPRQGAAGNQVDLVGQLCTPKDTLSRDVPAPRPLRVGDRVAFAMAGAYAWNISHHEFLMHPQPTFHYVRSQPAAEATASRPQRPPTPEADPAHLNGYGEVHGRTCAAD